MDDSARYQTYLEKSAEAYEGTCRQCGSCCGLDEKDPCVKLVQVAEGRYACSDYANRLGLQRTVRGNEFRCVEFRRIRNGSWAGFWKCGYKRT